jgi:signal transduction histidine kinase
MSLWRSALARVLAVFMVGIIIPTGSLVYLGVKSIQAETRLLMKESADRVGKTLEAMRDQSVAIIDGSRKFAEGLSPHTISTKPPGVSFFLALDAKHHLLYPIWEEPERNERNPPFLQLSLQRDFQAAEQTELKDHNYSRAQGEYRMLARRAPLAYWKVKFLLKVADCLVKLGQEDAAQAQYQEILSRYSAETDEMGRPFGLLVAIQLADLQMQEDRSSLAITTELNAYQDLLNGQWKLSWDNEQFFARQLQERLAELGPAMSAADHRQYAGLNSAWRLRENIASQSLEFMANRWDTMEGRIRQAGTSDRPILLFENHDINRGTWVIPFEDSRTGGRQGWLIAEIPCRELWAQISGTLDELAGAARAAYSVSLGESPIFRSRQAPGNHRYPLMSRIRLTSPVLTLEIGQLSDLPVQRLAERRRQIYLAVVALATFVILVALYATWHAVSREVQLAQLKARFVSSVSHELKTPLSIIGLIGQKLMLGRYRTGEEAHEYYGILAEEMNRLKSLIDDVLDFSRLLENRQPYRKEPTDLVPLVRETIDRYQLTHPGKDLGITFRPTADPCMVAADREAMGRVLLNLLDNAVKYSPPDRMHITVTLRRDGRQVVLEVADEGFGIPASELQLVFDRFYRGKSSMAYQKTNGVGLGLSIAQQIVQAHGGTIELRSTEGAGSTFSVSLNAAGDA